MAVLDGHITNAAVYGDINPRLTVGLTMLEFDWWPPHESIAGAGAVDELVDAWPVEANGQAISGAVAHAYSDDWYHRIHVIPRTLDLGNLVSEQVEEIHVWNAYLEPQSLLAIDGVEEGITLTGPDTFPMVFGALQISSWDVSVSQDGPSTIDAVISWNFDGVADGVLILTGVRIIAWTFVPDWGQTVRERITWATDVLASPTAVEQRRGLRIAPRRTFEVRMVVADRERSLFDLMLHGWGSKVWALPVWPDVQILAGSVSLGATSISCSTTGRDFHAGGLAMLRGESAFASETVEIAAVSGGGLTLVRPTLQAWPAGTRLYPVRTARFPSSPRVRRVTDRASLVEAEFVTVEPSDWVAAALSTYRGFPVFDARPDESEDITGSVERLLAVLDPVTGLPYVVDTAGAPIGMQSHRWVLAGVSERAAFRSLLYALAGRRVSVWVPTHADDLTVIATIGASATTVQIQNVGYSRFGLGQLGRQDIRIELVNGTVFYRRITDAVENDSASEQISINTSLGQTVEPTAIWRISFMMLARSDADEVQIDHVTDIEGVATSVLNFRGTRDDL